MDFASSLDRSRWFPVYELDDGDSSKISLEQTVCSGNLDLLKKAKIDSKKG
jgi:hypothetical protein